MDFEQHLMEMLKEMRQDISEIKEQTYKTNGRVNSLEDWRDKYEGSVDELVNSEHETKGRDRLLYGLVGILLTMVITLIVHYIEKQ